MEKTKFYKVYEIIDNVCEELQVYPTYFVGAFVNPKDAQDLCKSIDISNCNSTKIVYDEITMGDVNDLKQYGLQMADEQAIAQIKFLLKSIHKNQDLEK